MSSNPSAVSALTEPVQELEAPSFTSPLYRNGLALLVSSLGASLLGYVYWIVAAHHATQSTIGQATALVAALTAIATMGQLALPGVLASYLPRVGGSAAGLVARTYLLAAAISGTLAFLFVLIAPQISDAFSVLEGTAPLVLFPIAVVVWALFALQDNALTGLRRAAYVPVENAIYGAAKLLALISLGAGLSAVALMLTWVLPAAVALIPVSWLLFRRLIPQHAAGRERAEDMGGVRRYFAADSAGIVLSQISVTLMPVIVVARLGTHDGGAFGIAWLLVLSLDLLAANLGMSLTVEGAHNERHLPRLHASLRRHTVALVAVLSVVGIVIAPQLLSLFGSNYAEDGTVVLRLMLLGSLGRAVIVLGICAARAGRQTNRIVKIQAGLAALAPLSVWILAGELSLTGVGIAWAASNTIVAAGVYLTSRVPRVEGAAAIANAQVEKVLLVNHWHDDNKGDSAITLGTLRVVAERWPSVQASVATLHEDGSDIASNALRHASRGAPVTTGYSLAPTEFGGGELRGGRLDSLRWLLRMSPLMLEILLARPRASTRKRLQEQDLVVAVGGSNIYDDPGVAMPFSVARLTQVLYPVWAAGELDVPCVLAGHTLGPFPRRFGRAVAKHMLKNVDETILRESTSIETAETLELKNVTVLPDFAFALRPDLTERVARNIGPGELERRVAFVPRQFPHGDSARDEKLVESFVEAAKRFLADGTIDDVVVVAHAHGPTPIEDDREIAAQVVESVADPRCRLVDQDLAPSELQALYGACGFVVTVRLHAAILGLSQGTPALAIAYFTNKTSGIMADAGLGDSCITYEDLSGSAIVDALASKHDRDALMRAQAEREERLREAFAQHRN